MGQLNIATEEEQLNDSETQKRLKKYRVDYNEGKGAMSKEFTELQEALVLLDRLTDYGYGSDNQIALYQSNNLVKIYTKRQWTYNTKNSIYI
jgi:hypothetical protein